MHNGHTSDQSPSAQTAASAQTATSAQTAALAQTASKIGHHRLVVGDLSYVIPATSDHFTLGPCTSCGAAAPQARLQRDAVAVEDGRDRHSARTSPTLPSAAA